METTARLLARAWLAGCNVELEGRDLRINGPRRADAIIDEIKSRQTEVIVHFLSLRCGALHVQPERWTHKSGRAHCPRCGRFMGYVLTPMVLQLGSSNES